MKVRKEVWYVLAIVVIILAIMFAFRNDRGLSPARTTKSNSLKTTSHSTQTSNLRDIVVSSFKLGSIDQSQKTQDIAALSGILKKDSTNNYYDKSGVAKANRIVTGEKN